MTKHLLLPVCALLSAMSVNAQSTATVTPVTISSGFNQDVIAENTTVADGYLKSVSNMPPAMRELQGIDASSFVYYTKDCQEAGAMCGADGNFETTNGIKYHVNPNAANALVLKPTGKGGVMSGTLMFAQTHKAKSIYACGTSSDGDTDLKVVVNYADGTNKESTITFYNWDSTTSLAAAATVVSGLGRMPSRNPGWGSYTVGVVKDALNFRIFQASIDTDNTKEIKSLTISKTSDTNSGCAIFAVTVSNESVGETTGLGNLTTQKNPKGYYTLDGARVSEPVKGVNIIKYTDGTARKIIVR